MKVKVIGEKGNWICARLANLLRRLPYVEVAPNVELDDQLVYYVPYLFYPQYPAVAVKKVAFFTHFTPGKQQHQFAEIAKAMDHCVVMADQYADFLGDIVGVGKVSKFRVPVDKGFHPRKLRLGWYNRVYTDHRKREDWIHRLRAECHWLEIKASNGKMDLKAVQWSMREQDAVLVTAEYEGGPMCLLEALASGVSCVVGDTVGFVNEFRDCPGVIVYDTGSYSDLMEKLEQLYAERQKKTEAVKGFTAEAWVESHDRLFRRLLAGTRRLL